MKNKERRNQINCHHKIGQSLKQDFVVDETRNKIMMSMIEHNHFHGYFKSALTPKSQFEKLRDLTDSVLSELAKSLLKQLIELEDKDFYSKGIVRNGKHR